MIICILCGAVAESDDLPVENPNEWECDDCTGVNVRHFRWGDEL